MWIPNSSRCVLEWKLDSGLGIPDSLSVEIGFHIPIVTGITDSWVEFRIPKPRISDSTNKDFPDSGIWIDNLTEAVIPTNNRGLKQRRRRRQRERQKGNMFRSTKQQLCTYITRFFCISLLSLHDYNVKVPNFTFCRGRERRRRLSFSFPELWYSLLEFHLGKICQHLTNWTS